VFVSVDNSVLGRLFAPNGRGYDQDNGDLCDVFIANTIHVSVRGVVCVCVRVRVSALIVCFCRRPAHRRVHWLRFVE
jgi:hypothetical protein